VLQGENRDPVIEEGCGAAIPHHGLVLDALRLNDL
jgi:hypothetical protein